MDKWEKLAQDNWVSTDHEGFPNDDRRVLVCTADGEINIARFVFGPYEWVLEDGTRLEAQYSLDSFTHWRLFPQPPQ